jgi:hypothetical protein
MGELLEISFLTLISFKKNHTSRRKDGIETIMTYYGTGVFL